MSQNQKLQTAGKYFRIQAMTVSFLNKYIHTFKDNIRLKDYKWRDEIWRFLLLEEDSFFTKYAFDAFQ